MPSESGSRILRCGTKQATLGAVGHQYLGIDGSNLTSEYQLMKSPCAYHSLTQHAEEFFQFEVLDPGE